MYGLDLKLIPESHLINANLSLNQGTLVEEFMLKTVGYLPFTRLDEIKFIHKSLQNCCRISRCTVHFLKCLLTNSKNTTIAFLSVVIHQGKQVTKYSHENLLIARYKAGIMEKSDPAGSINVYEKH